MKWEYMVADDLNSLRGQPTDGLNKLGREGWELVTARNTRAEVTEYIFKRPLEEGR